MSTLLKNIFTCEIKFLTSSPSQHKRKLGLSYGHSSLKRSKRVVRLSGMKKKRRKWKKSLRHRKKKLLITSKKTKWIDFNTSST